MITDEMLKVCRKQIPVTRQMNESDDQHLLECFQNYVGVFQLTSQRIEHFVKANKQNTNNSLQSRGGRV